MECPKSQSVFAHERLARLSLVAVRAGRSGRIPFAQLRAGPAAKRQVQAGIRP